LKHDFSILCETNIAIILKTKKRFSLSYTLCETKIKKPSHQTVKGRSKNCKIVVMPYAKTSSGG
jgi:hypothetical protein